jgi:glyoxylase-like metal-dependent hydrolase (beta-lactamase superfamily II)
MTSRLRRALPLLMALIAPVAPAETAPAVSAGEVLLSPRLRVRPLRDGYWLHVSENADGIASNGLLAPLPEGGVLLVDTAWDDAQTELLLDFAAARLGGIRDAVITHAHADRNGGVGALRRRGVRPLGLDLTVEKARAEGSPQPDVFLRAGERVRRDPRGFEVFYPGPGHTLDNIVVAFPAARLLAGGCLVKAKGAGTGYVCEAFPRDWPAAIDALRERYAGATLVVPGRGDLGPPGPAFARTIELAQAEAEREARAPRGAIHADVPEKPDRARRYVIYAHGRILEQQGRRATSPDFGRYEYDAILAALAERGFEVISEVRTPQNSETFGARLAAQVRRLREAGVPAERITLVGASRGGLLVQAAAAEVQHPGLTLVVLAGCGPDSVALAPRLRGRMLSVYDSADRFTAACRATFDAARDLTASREIVVHKGLDHGLLYRPYADWLDPASAWIRGVQP